MVGNAVPPTLAFHLAKEIISVLEEKEVLFREEKVS